MRGRLTARVAWFWFGVAVIVTVWDMAQTISERSQYANVFALLDPLLFGFAAVLFTFVGALIIARKPGNSVGWVLLVPSLAIIFDFWARRTLNGLETAPANPSFALLLAGWSNYTLWVLVIFPALFLLQLFPTGRPLTPRWRLLVMAGLAMIAYFFVVAALLPEYQLGESLTITNPVGLSSEVDFAGGIWVVALVLFTLASGVSLLLRYRRAGPIERDQIKWLLFACSLFVAVYLIGPWVSDEQSTARDIWGNFLALSFIALPVAIGIAILRYRLWDIDVLIRRTLVYAVLTGLLALVYFGCVILLQLAAGSITGEESPLVIVLSTLAIAALFTPLRRRVQQGIDRRFFRRKYDATRVMAEFGESLKRVAGGEDGGIEQLTGRVLNVLQETMEPERVGLWLRPAGAPGKRVEE